MKTDFHSHTTDTKSRVIYIVNLIVAVADGNANQIIHVCKKRMNAVFGKSPKDTVFSICESRLR